MQLKIYKYIRLLLAKSKPGLLLLLAIFGVVLLSLHSHTLISCDRKLHIPFNEITANITMCVILATLIL